MIVKGKRKRMANHWKRLRGYEPGPRRARIAEMSYSPAAQRPNTNEWRVARAYEFLYAPVMGGNPLAELITFLRTVGKYVDPESSLSENEQILREVPPGLVVDHSFRCLTAMPGVPQDHLERAMSYVERRIELVPGNGHRARSNREWLGRWSRAIMAELERRERHGDLPPPPVRDGLKLSWAEITAHKRAAAAAANVDAAYLQMGAATIEELAATRFDQPPRPAIEIEVEARARSIVDYTPGPINYDDI